MGSLYVEVHQSLAGHPKTKKAMRLLGISKPQLIGHMVCLWFWCQQYAKDGDLSTYDNGEIADGAEWDGDADQFINALITCGSKDGGGFLVRDGKELFVNDWHEYGGKIFKEREAGARRQAEWRKRHNALRNTDDNGMSPLRNDDVTVMLPDVTRLDRDRDNTRQDERGDRDRIELTTKHVSNGAASNTAGANGSVDVYSFTLDVLSQIGFRDADKFLENVDLDLASYWAWYYLCQPEKARSTIKNWPALINKQVRDNQKPRLSDEQQTAFWKQFNH